jgi:hypothetical protein
MFKIQQHVLNRNAKKLGEGLSEKNSSDKKLLQSM